MSQTFTPMPLADVTNKRMFLANKQLNFNAMKPALQTVSCANFLNIQTMMKPVIRRNDPYAWCVLPRDEEHEKEILRHREREAQERLLRAAALRALSLARTNVVAQPSPNPIVSCTVVSPATPLDDASNGKENFPMAPLMASKPVCQCLVQFKCHHAEFASSMPLMKGQFVVVGGDRGVDIGIVLRINTEETKTYVEKTGPSGNILRHATQREVDYWNTDLKADEAAALDYVRQRVQKHRLPMEVKHAEYQFDKKKLTFYYESKTRVDFVLLLKDLFREFSCRIWMEKVRTGPHE